MNTVKGTVIQFVILGVAGIAIGLTANAVRAKNRIVLTKNYFRVDKPPPDAPTPKDDDKSGVGTAKPPKPKPSEESTSHYEHGYQEIVFADVKAVFEDPSTAAGGTVFIDARTKAAYEDGHIPGAFQLDHYRLGNYDSDYIDYILQSIEGAEKVIAFCNGGDCEDSIFMCGDLIEWDVPYDKVYLYPGGYKEWKRNGMPIDMGGDDEE